MTHSLEPAALLPDHAPGSTWSWRMFDAAGAEIENPLGGDASFPSQSDAESWLGEVFADLFAGGVEAVTLFDADREVYGPMPLRA